MNINITTNNNDEVINFEVVVKLRPPLPCVSAFDIDMARVLELERLA